MLGAHLSEHTPQSCGKGLVNSTRPNKLRDPCAFVLRNYGAQVLET
jgi:hypothetical protein